MAIALATVGASLALATVTVAAIVTVTESSPLSVVPPLSFRVVIVTTRLLSTVGASSVFLYARALIKVSIADSEIPAPLVQVSVAVVPSIVTTAAPLLVEVDATHVAAVVMSQLEPSITMNSSPESATFVIVIFSSTNVCVAVASLSAASADE